MKRVIVITYKNGSSINLDVPETYYKEKYSKKSDKKLHQIFMKEYSNFVKALNSTDNIVQVGKYLKFSNATVNGKDVLSIDIKNMEEEAKPLDNTIFIPGVHDKVYLDLTDTRLDNFLTKVEELETLENVDALIKKLVSYFNKSNVEFTIKAGAKKTTTSTRKKKAVEESSKDSTPVEVVEVR